VLPDPTGRQPLTGFLASWPPTAPGVTAHRLDLRFLDRDLGQEHLVLAGRAIAYAFATTQITRWAAETHAETGAAEAAIEFVKADIAGIATEFDLLATGGLDRGDSRTPRSINTAASRSIPVHTQTGQGGPGMPAAERDVSGW
jgi:hypothetical protein